jgi:cell division protein FtsZ
MSINLKAPELRELKPRIMVAGVGGAGGNAVNNMIASGLCGVDFIVANTDAQALTASRADRIIQMGLQVTEGLGAGSQPEVGRAAAEEAIEEIRDHLTGAHMCFVTAGMGGGTGTGAAPVIAQAARDMGILTVGVVTKPFQFEGQRRMRLAEGGIRELQECVDTLIVIPNQNLFRVANEKTTFADAFAMADQVLYSGVACITDLMVKEGLINLDFADVRAVMREMGKAMMGTGEASGDGRAVMAAEAAIANPLLDETSMKGARGLLISITGGSDLTLYEVDEAASRIRQEVDEEANIILGATFDDALDGIIRVSVVATGIDSAGEMQQQPPVRIADVLPRPRMIAPAAAAPAAQPAPAPVAAAAPAPQFKAIEQDRFETAAEAEDTHNDDHEHERYQSEPEPVAATLQPQPAPAPAPAPVAASEPAPAPAPVPAPAPAYEHYHQEAPQQAAYQAPAQAPAYAPAAQAEPAAEVVRPVPMPRVEDLPLPVQEQLRAQRGDAPAQPSGPEQKRRSLLERLASFGVNRDSEPAPVRQQPAMREPGPMVQPPRAPAAAQPRPVAPPAAAVQAAMPPAAPLQPQAPQMHSAPPAQPAQAQPGPTHAAYGKRPAPQPARAPQQAQLDLHGRPQQPQLRPIEDEQLEIPAFLRRQTG